jgi:pilus assembly protein CpaB
MRPKSLILLMLALGCGLVASVGITQVLAKRNTLPGGAAIAMDPIFVAIKDIPVGEIVTPELIKLEEWPKDKIPAGALAKLEDVEGRRPKSKIYAGSPILNDQLLGKGEKDISVTRTIPTGFRVVAVRVDDVSGSAALLQPGDRVDVLVFLERNASKGVQTTSTRTVLQDIKVFAVDQLVELDPDEGKSAGGVKTVSLLVTADQAETVMLASELGRIRLTMRSLVDDSVAQVGGKTPGELFGETEGSEDRLSRPSEAPPAAPSSSGGFLDFLTGQRKPPVVENVVAEPARNVETWTVRLLSAEEVREMILEADRAPASSDGSAPKEFRWRLVTPLGDDDAVAQAPAMIPASEAPQDTPPPKEDSADSSKEDKNTKESHTDK